MSIDTVNDLPPIAQYTAAVAQTVFPYPFPIFVNADLRVHVDGVLKVLTTDYTVSGATNPTGGNVTFLVAPGADKVITIYRDIAIQRLSDFQQNGPLASVTVNDELDRMTLVDQQLESAITRTVRVDVADAGSTSFNPLPVKATRAGKFIAFDMDGQPIASAGTGADAGLRIDLANGLSGPGSDLVAIKRTATEIAALVTPTNFVYEELHVRRYGAALNNSTNDYTAINNAVLVAEAAGGGRVHGFVGATAVIASELIVRDGVILDLEDGKIRATLSGTNEVGVRLRNRSQVINGEIEVDSSGSPGSQGGIHAPICVGPLYGLGGTVAAPSADNTVSGWVVRNMKLHTDRNGRWGIQVMGGANNGLIDNIEIPDNSVMVGAVGLDWGFVGTIDSADITTSRTNFDAGTAYTLHPHNIRICNVKCGALTRTFTTAGTGSIAVRCAAVHNITVENVHAEETTEAGVFFTAGDLGYEFAPAILKPLAHKGNRFQNITVKDANNGNLVYCDCYADNVDAAGGYTELVDVRAECDIVFEQVIGRGNAGASVIDGFRIRLIKGVTLLNCDASGFLRGVEIEEGADRVRVQDGRFWFNREDGVYVGNGTDLPEDCEVIGIMADQNGQDAGATTSAGIKVEDSRRAKLHNNKLGANGYVAETTQDRGISVTNVVAIDVDIQNNYVNSAVSFGYVIAAGGSYGVLKIFANNHANLTNVPTVYTGTDIIPYAVGSDFNGWPIRSCIATNSVTPPTAGTWTRGELIYISDQAVATGMGNACVTSGTFSAATDGTGDTDGSTAVITGMADTSDFFVGEYVTVSAGFASTGPFRIRAKTASSITVSANSNSVQANVTVSTPDPVFGAMPALA